MKLTQGFGLVFVALILASGLPQRSAVLTTIPIVVSYTMMTPVVKRAVKKHRIVTPGLSAFLSLMSKTESRGQPNVVSQYGMLGKYQFAPSTLHKMGYEVSSDSFLQNVTLQDQAMLSLMRNNRRFLSKVIREFSGQVVDGVYVTESGILAGAHLVGPKGILAFFYPEQYQSPLVDRNGKTVQQYMIEFAKFDLKGL